MTNALAPIDHDQLLAKAIESQVPVESLERLLAMRKELVEEQAKREYFEALARFQSECPVIPKRKEVRGKNGSVRYRYAPIEDVIEVVKPLLDKHGFSYSIKTFNHELAVESTCEIHHIGGHTEKSSFAVPIDKDAFMNDSQKAASASTFTKRYAFQNAFGILTGDEDDDGQALGGETTAKDIYARVCTARDARLRNWESIAALKSAIREAMDRIDNGLDPDYVKLGEIYYEIGDEDMQALYLAPTKGGDFLTIERQFIKEHGHTMAKVYKGGETEQKADLETDQ